MRTAADSTHDASSFRLKLRTAFLLLAGTLLISTSVNAQATFTRIYGPEDQAVPMPAFVGSLNEEDTGAVQELIAYQKAADISPWKGLQAAGVLTDSSGNTDQATLTIVNSNQFRLDVQTPNGVRSIRISGTYGATLEPDGNSFLMPPATAKAGLFAFPQLLAATFPTANMALIDRGLVQIGGQSLHRITVEEPIAINETTTDGHDTGVTDLYFDPSTHLLLKSASAVQLDPTDRERYLIVISYGNYQKIQQSLVPCTYSESLNGQQQWTLQLNTPNLQPVVDSSYFTF